MTEADAVTIEVPAQTPMTSPKEGEAPDKGEAPTKGGPKANASGEAPPGPPMFNRRDPGVSAGYRRSIYALPVQVDVILGTVTPTVKDVLAFETGTVLTLREALDAPVTLSVNGHVIAVGELVETGTDTPGIGVRISRLFDVPDDLV